MKEISNKFNLSCMYIVQTELNHASEIR